ncbi:MAG: hypothetical protein Q4C86_14145 [bacterium]|nr:hypothetical protein [bacterium]
MIKFINLQFFKGGTEVQEVDKRGPKSDELKAMDSALYNVFGGLIGRYGGVQMPTLSGQQEGGSAAGAAAGWSPGGYLDRSFDLADEQAKAAQGNVSGLLEMVQPYMTAHQGFLRNGTDAGFEDFLGEQEGAIANAYARNVGTDLNSLASRGVLNSSVTSRALEGQQRATGEAIANNRNQAANVWLSNYLAGANAANEGAKAQSALVPQLYQSAVAPLMPGYQFWRDMTGDYYKDEKDYIATSGGK